MQIHEMFPYLRVSDAAAAIAFYIDVFEARERFRLVEPSGRIGHAELEIGPSVLMLSDAFPEYGLPAPPADGSAGATIHLHVDDCDALGARMQARGGVMLMAPTDHFYGERTCRMCDPFGHVWLLGHQIEVVTPEEMQRRYTAMFATGGG